MSESDKSGKPELTVERTAAEIVGSALSRKIDEVEALKARIAELEAALKLTNTCGLEIKWFTFDMFKLELMRFALAYSKSTSKDISNDASEWASEIFTNPHKLEP